MKEALGGYLVFEAESLEAATELDVRRGGTRMAMRVRMRMAGRAEASLPGARSFRGGSSPARDAIW